MFISLSSALHSAFKSVALVTADVDGFCVPQGGPAGDPEFLRHELPVLNA
jgi:hypothetical protein